MAEFRTPLAKVRGLGASRTGTVQFWRQRLTAVAGIPLTLAALALFVSLAGNPHGQVVQVLSHPLAALLLAAGLITVVWHMRLGAQMIIEDYVHHCSWKLVCLILNNFYCGACLLAGLYALLRLSLGG